MTDRKHEATHRLPAHQRASIAPGEYRVTKKPMILTTLLGSCVAVCLYDPVSKVAGMNHFLLPVQRIPDAETLGSTAEGRYGMFAMELLINDLIKAGARKALLRAKVFGGASLLRNPGNAPLTAVGPANCRFVKEFLDVEGIAIDGSDLGGSQGRVIHFHTDTLQVFRRYIKSSATEDKIALEETREWQTDSARLRSTGETNLF